MRCNSRVCKGVRSRRLIYSSFNKTNTMKKTVFAMTIAAGLLISSAKATPVQPPTDTVPEPSTYALLALGTVVMLIICRRKKTF